MSSNSNTSRCILVTGASRGIGFATALQLIEAGHHVVGISRHAPEQQTGMDFYPCDLENLELVSHTINSIVSNHAIDAVILNAGRGDIASLENFSAHQIERSVSLNLISPLIIARHCLPILRTRNRSDIIFVGSESALQGGRYGSVYSAAKFGLRGAAQALRHECANANCHVGIVNPGMVRTHFFDDLTFEPGPATTHALRATDVANAIMSMMDAADNAVIDEITLNPLQKVVARK